MDAIAEEDKSYSLGSLPYADDEVIEVSKICKGTYYVNSDVTPSKVFQTINDFKIIHFSTHAFVDNADYLQSYLVLNKDKFNEYKLKYSDILNLSMNSQMVVLSACHTSSGKSVIGEGLMSLSRAFVQSGSQSAIGSYWNAPDYTTKELMTIFYSNLITGMSKSKALQKAQIEFLTNDKLSSPAIRAPFYWASWAIYGNNQPLSLKDSMQSKACWKCSLSLSIGVVITFLIGFFVVHKLSSVPF
jgi:CHAT domain-containing protein